MHALRAILWLRLKLFLRRARGAAGIANVLAAGFGALFGLAIAFGMAGGFGTWVWITIDNGDRAGLRIAYLVAFWVMGFVTLILPLLPGGLEQGFDVSRFRGFPVGRVRLFAFQLLAGFGAGEQILIYPTLAAIAGAGVLMPGLSMLAGAGILGLVLLVYVTWNNALNLLMVAVMRQRRLREILAFVGFFVLIVVSMAPMIVERLVEDMRPSRRQAGEWVAPIVDAAMALPPSVAAAGLAALYDGNAGAVLRKIVLLLVWNVAGCGLGYFAFARYHGAVPRSRARRSVGKRKAIETGARESSGFDHPALGFLPAETRAVAAKDLYYIFRSVIGKFNLVMIPVFVTVMAFVLTDVLQNTVLGLAPQDTILFGLMLYATLFSNMFVNNAYAWEADGVQAYFIGPVSLRGVIIGKNIAVWIYNTLLVVVSLTAWSVVVGLPGPATLLTALLVYAVSLVTLTTWGNLLSILFPVRRNMSAIGSSPSQIAVLASLVLLVAIGAVIGLFLLVPVLLDLPYLRPLFVAALLAVQVFVYTLVLRASARLLGERREKLIHALEAER